MSEIISNIIKAMKIQGISQSELARRLNLNQKSVNNLLAGRTKKLDVDIIGRITNHLGIDNFAGNSPSDSTSELNQIVATLDAANIEEVIKFARDRQMVQQCAILKAENAALKEIVVLTETGFSSAGPKPKKEELQTVEPCIPEKKTTTSSKTKLK